ncbi:endonuclease VII domain-containing protein [Pseudarthrobacter defluvii]|uniref:endonuclease VII domain-containing protein n=1 Tax=Pseudarthrobacter defluvii TaxID=410837 RepID=UPI00330787CA
MSDEWNKCEAVDGTCDRPARHRRGKYCSQHGRMSRLGKPLVKLAYELGDGEWNMCQAVDGTCDRQAQARRGKYCARHRELHAQGKPLVPLKNKYARDGEWNMCQAVDGTCGRKAQTAGSKYCTRHAELNRDGKPMVKLRESRPRGTDPLDCTFDGCDKLAVAKGLCPGHYQQSEAGQELTPLRYRRPRGSASARNERGEKHCPGCNQWLPESDFHDSPSTTGLSHTCRLCTAARMVARKYNLPPEEYRRMLEEQGGACGSCGKVPENRRLVVDHDHSCCPTKTSCGDCIRGLLCDDCNWGIGRLGDTEAAVRGALEYLVRSNNRRVRLPEKGESAA